MTLPVMQPSQLFAKPEPKVFGNVYNGKYHMPLLPGEAGVKSGGDWVPYGMMRATNLCGAISESRALNIWEQELALIGLALSPSLYEKLCIAVHRWQQEGVDFLNIKEHPDVRLLLTGFPKHEDQSIIGQAKARAGGTEAREAGSNRHEAWEHRALTGELIGTPEMQEQLLTVERLLEEKGLRRIPGLSERTVRNTEVNCAGRFDDCLMEYDTGRMIMGDLKTKRKKFYTWLEVDAQLAIYARSKHMVTLDRLGYEDGPVHYVDQTEAVVLHAPSDGSPAYLRRADLVSGWQTALLARQVVDRRSWSKSAERHALSEWTGTRKDLQIAS